ncbi:hypothetical protein E2C01_093227 [Portunus trituberculatus]|uniref:Uncharacterized protein n=1 Tax=Portunus trituberculatus TaxID=210409 RepID=A0A5B7JSN6_PORTR|nr:hypothetical protein [Portunus trituberculatus]
MTQLFRVPPLRGYYRLDNWTFTCLSSHLTRAKGGYWQGVVVVSRRRSALEVFIANEVGGATPSMVYPDHASSTARRRGIPLPSHLSTLDKVQVRLIFGLARWWVGWPGVGAFTLRDLCNLAG